MAKKITDKDRLDFLQSLCPKTRKTDYDFNLAWTCYAWQGGHVAVRGMKKTIYRSSVRRAIDAVMLAERPRRKSK